ncbi:MAG: hypothetical protein E6K80_15195 [Candidatus Eisenbacteria bacterium]|uniref:Uncharacterized protein n=1 Tax=Eiseniibacteriota bacterium TaxID=2212470 RepID=A0A538TV66_UNCEI|nr:MAG: hypothetical protein E6K80_15195 [Candidatus Eisenbacteria bacterium]
MIRTPIPLDPPAPRLLAAVESTERSGLDTLVVGGGCVPRQLGEALARGEPARILVMSALGAHPDARAPRLRTLWDLEEAARGAERPVLVLRLGPIVGLRSPLWLRLRSRPALPDQGRALVNPVVEDDVIETLSRGLDGRASWSGWYEVAGAEALTLSELAELAARSEPAPRGSGEWEPPLAEWLEHRLAETGPWCEHFGVVPRRVSSEAPRWA